MNEKDTRLKLIDPALKKAGWSILNQKHIIEKDRACIETPVVGIPKTSENPTGNGFVDYVLFGDDGKPLAVIEAKKSIYNEDQGRVQACVYADALELKYGVRPIIYYTNGYNIKMIDGIYPAHQVFGFHKKDELEYLIKRREYTLKDKSIDANICGRYYQQDAINTVIQHLETKHSKSLIVLATGTGKTRVSCAISDILLRNNYVKRILFLADRKNLVIQAKEETYEKFLEEVPMFVIVDGKKEGDESKARIVFSTYQSMLSIIKDTKKCPYGIGHFDLIIVDEAHRSLFNKYGEIFNYFDSMMIGLTATPRNDIHKSTYRVFDLADDMPNYEYDIVKGVKDGYLTYYRALDRTPEILKNGLVYNDLSDEEKEQYEDLFTEDDGELPEKIEGSKFYSVITNKDTIREVLKDLMAEGLRVNNGDVLGKTIIFAKDHNHAVLIKEEFDKLYPELCNTKSRNGVDYCVVIDNQIKYNEILQREFKEKQDIRIVVSVDMMDTGVDIPEVVNLVFFKKVLSKIKFWQMVGRGTRICNDLKVLSPSKAYFERETNDKTRQHYNSKQGFLIFDICNVFPFFKLNPDGEIDSTDTVLSLYQRIFMQKVALYSAMQYNYAKLSIDDKKYYEELRESLYQEVNGLNRNYIGVIKNLKEVEYYSTIDGWIDFSHNKLVEIKKKIAPNIQGSLDLETSRMFDYLCYKFCATRFKPDNNFVETAKTIFSLTSYLINKKSHVSEIKQHIDTLNFVASDDFLHGSTITQVDSARAEIRDLMKYLDKKIVSGIISDFDDEINNFDDAEEEAVDFHVTIDDFKTLEEKVLFMIHSDEKLSLIDKIKNMEKPSEEDIKLVKDMIVAIAKSADEYNGLFDDDNSIVTFIRKNVELNPKAVESFLTLQKEKGFNEEQILYIKELLLFISQNGKFETQDLLREELNFNEIFNSVEINALIDDIKQIF